MEATNIFAKLATKYEAGFDDFLPKRVQILAKGFAEGWDLVRVNEKLLEEECETLYARSFFEAGLIFAYDHGMSYPEWEELFARCMAIHDDRMESGGFTGGKISLQQLKQYVCSGSDEQMQTQSVTRRMARELGRQETAAGFLQFMRENLDSFSGVREKARYYFCKYLYFYIQEMCRRYENACQKEEAFRRRYGTGHAPEERGLSEKFALEHLTFLKPLTKLKKEAEKAKPTMTVQEKMVYLQAASALLRARQASEAHLVPPHGMHFPDTEKETAQSSASSAVASAQILRTAQIILPASLLTHIRSRNS